MTTSERAWAKEEFGDAELSDPRRAMRLVDVAEAAAHSPAGTVTAVCRGSAAREGAFRFLENESVLSTAVATASHEAAIKRCRKYGRVFVPLDGSSLSLTDRGGGRDVGSVGAWRQGGRGLLVTSALAVSPDGTPLGICGQAWWARTERSTHTSRHSMSGEMRHGVDLLANVRRSFAAVAPGVTPWFQLDRGYDAWPVLLLACREKMLLTVRAAYSRCVRADRSAPKSDLFTVARRAPVLGAYDLTIPGRDGVRARSAHMDVRACSVMLELKTSSKKREYVSMNVVFVKERRQKNPVHWMLLTTAPIASLAEARAIVDGYASRWRIEEFHRAWKQGVCNVEDTQLRSREAILKWATILAAVAVRATRLTYLAREKPDAPASDELSRPEIDAVIALRQPKNITLGAEPTLEQAVRWIADLGGYVGKSSGGPPGATVVARGLAKVAILAEGMGNVEKMR